VLDKIVPLIAAAVNSIGVVLQLRSSAPPL